MNVTHCLSVRLSILLLGSLCGCAGDALKRDYADYSEVYSQAVNRQLLLNLARLSHDEPAYFIQLGNISSQYKFDASSGFTPSHASVIHPGGNTQLIQRTLTFGGSLGASVDENPVFQFLPLNGNTFAQTIASPIADKVFDTFYEQGYHADLLIRITVASVQRPSKTDAHKSEYLVNNPMDSTYPQFLEFCDSMRKAQLEHALISDTTDTGDLKINSANLSDIAYAKGAGLEVKQDKTTNAYTVGHQQTSGFKVNDAWTSSEQDKAFIDFVKTFEKNRTKFQMRTFEAAMYSVAKEEVYFDWKQNQKGGPITFSHDEYGSYVEITPTTGNDLRIRPIIQLQRGYPSTARLRFSELTSLLYDGVVYSVGDLEGYAKDGSRAEPTIIKTYNRTVFTMLSYLFSQISIDTQKLPSQQFIQVQ